MTRAPWTAALVLGIALCAPVAVANAQTPPCPTPAAARQVTLARARLLAVARVPGIVLHEEMTSSARGWTYTFAIETVDSRMARVEVDASTGTVLRVRTLDAWSMAEG